MVDVVVAVNFASFTHQSRSSASARGQDFQPSRNCWRPLDRRLWVTLQFKRPWRLVNFGQPFRTPMRNWPQCRWRPIAHPGNSSRSDFIAGKPICIQGLACIAQEFHPPRRIGDAG